MASIPTCHFVGTTLLLLNINICNNIIIDPTIKLYIVILVKLNQLISIFSLYIDIYVCISNCSNGFKFMRESCYSFEHLNPVTRIAWKDCN